MKTRKEYKKLVGFVNNISKLFIESKFMVIPSISPRG